MPAASARRRAAEAADLGGALPDTSQTPVYSDPFAAAVERVTQQGTAVAIAGIYIAQAMAARRAERLDGTASAARRTETPRRVASPRIAAGPERAGTERRVRSPRDNTPGPRNVAEEVLTERRLAQQRQLAEEATARAFGREMAALIRSDAEYDACARRLIDTATSLGLPADRADLLLTAARWLGPRRPGEAGSLAGFLSARLDWIAYPGKAPGWAARKAHEVHDRLVTSTRPRASTRVVDGEAVNRSRSSPGQNTARARQTAYPCGPTPRRLTTPATTPTASKPGHGMAR
jgi:hypothetical protein